MGFINFYSWLKYASTPTSYVFRNRLFLEKTFRSNNIYPFLGETHRSFSWLPLSSSNTSIYWFNSSYVRLLFFLLLLVLPFYFYLNTGWVLPSHPITYTFWRALDIFYIFIIQIQYVFLTTVVYAAFTLSNFIVSTNFSFVRWMRKNHAEVLLTSTESRKAQPTLVRVPLLDSTPLSVKYYALDTAVSSLPADNILFFKHLYRLIPFIINDTALSTNLGNNNSRTNQAYCPNYSQQRSRFTLNALAPNRSVNILNFDHSRPSTGFRYVFETLTSNFVNFFKVSRWISLYCASPEKLTQLGTPGYTTSSSINFYVNREILQQSLYSINKTPYPQPLVLNRPFNFLSTVSPNPVSLKFYMESNGQKFTRSIFNTHFRNDDRVGTNLKSAFSGISKLNLFLPSKISSSLFFYNKLSSNYQLTSNSPNKTNKTFLSRWL